jgi:hypothetical protein
VRFVLALVLSLAAEPAWAFCQRGLSEGTPPIRLAHIFCGEVRPDGRAVGFHSRPGGENPAGVSETTNKRADPARPGIYTLRGFRITEGDRSGVKTLSTMFPDHCDAKSVVAAIRNAYATGTRDGNRFAGESGSGCADSNGKSFRIEGFTATREGRLVIVTAYPN